MNQDFFNDYTDGFKYPEIAVCLDDTEGPKAKIYIPVITPTLSKNIAYDSADSVRVNTRNIISNTKTLNITPCIESNYIELKLPDNKPAKKNEKFIISFIGGDINKPVLIGRYEL